MLTINEKQRLKEICRQNPDLETILKKIEQNHQFKLSQISHEIRNPVTLINSFLQLFAASNPKVTTGPYWSEIIENMQYLRSLLTELSNYNNSRTLHRKKGNLHKLVQSILETATPAMTESHITVRLIKETPIPSFDFDAVKLKQVFLNLIRNAQEAMPSGGLLTISLRTEANLIILKFQDNGCGIPIEHLPTLFDSFVTHKKDGTGLGLAIAKDVIEAHGGSIGAQSKTGYGACFTIELPVFFL